MLADFELVLQLEGASWIWSEPDGGSVDVPSGAVAFIPPGFIHAWGFEHGLHLAVHFDLQARPHLHFPANMQYLTDDVHRDPLAFVPAFGLRPGGSGREMVIPLVTILHASSQIWREQLLSLVELWSRRGLDSLDGKLRVAEVVSFALRSLAIASGRDRADGAERIVELMRRLDDPGDDLGGASIAELARTVYMGETSFRAAFSGMFGCPPRRYLEQRRIEQAALALLHTDRTIAEIGRSAGYKDPYQFSRVFSRVTGMSPRLYRKSARTSSTPSESTP